MLGEALKVSKKLNINTLDSVVLMNRGDHFEVRPLPAEAQWSSVQGIVAADFDGDGAEDLFLSQNDFAAAPERERSDAGEGLLLRGDGKGGLQVVRSEDSGIHIPGSQRGAATADFDGDGRPDLVVTQNGDSTRLYQNRLAHPGLRVRLEGPAGNPSGVGVQLRVDYGGGRLGPVREVRAGNGYWSQDSPVTVLGFSGTPVGLDIRWPGHAPAKMEFPSGTGEIRMSEMGALLVH